MTTYARRLGLFSTTMAVVGGIIGGGIFRTPAAVAGRVGSPGLALAAWVDAPWYGKEAMPATTPPLSNRRVKRSAHDPGGNQGQTWQHGDALVSHIRDIGGVTAMY